MTAATLLLGDDARVAAAGDVGCCEAKRLGRESRPTASGRSMRVDDRPGDGAITFGSATGNARASWPAFQQPTSGYLGVRYIALTRGVGALEPSDSATTGGRDSSRRCTATNRNATCSNELLPSSQRAMNPRS